MSMENKYYASPVGQLANRILLQLLGGEQQIDESYQNIDVAGVPHDCYVISYEQYEELKMVLRTIQDKAEVIFWVKTPNGELIKQLVQSKHDPLRDVKLAG